jgi:hypothetical protein
MGTPTKPVTLTVAEIAELNEKLSTARHDINNQLSLIMATVEMLRLKPQMAERFLETLGAQPSRITTTLGAFSAEFEKALGISRS